MSAASSATWTMASSWFIVYLGSDLLVIYTGMRPALGGQPRTLRPSWTATESRVNALRNKKIRTS